MWGGLRGTRLPHPAKTHDTAWDYTLRNCVHTANELTDASQAHDNVNMWGTKDRGITWISTIHTAQHDRAHPVLVTEAHWWYHSRTANVFLMVIISFRFIMLLHRLGWPRLSFDTVFLSFLSFTIRHKQNAVILSRSRSNDPAPKDNKFKRNPFYPEASQEKKKKNTAVKRCIKRKKKKT